MLLLPFWLQGLNCDWIFERFELEQVPKWLSPKEKLRRRSAACVAAMIR